MPSRLSPAADLDPDTGLDIRDVTVRPASTSPAAFPWRNSPPGPARWAKPPRRSATAAPTPA
ncbi:hypothetical protein ACIPX0_34135 [Streptomyces sp. NPDC090075]|uniref:hypothetical protein n=1 Tax=Streptomyces sp. NPDC090075 TaxID=3365937 RepID=UPI00380C5427